MLRDGGLVVGRWRAVILFWALAGAANAAIWPDQLGRLAKTSSEPLAVRTDKAIWDEYGLETVERAVYGSGAKTLTATAYRLKDSTGALAAFQWQRPADARPSKLGELAAENPGQTLLAFGNYLLRFEKYSPRPDELPALLNRLPKLERAALPVLAGYLPARDLIPNSERFVLGPASLEKFGPGISPSLAAFHAGAEAQFGRYKAKGGEMAMAIFSYPTPQFARERLPKFEALPGAMVKRSGPLLAVILAPPNADDAERLLSAVRYQAEVTVNERVPTRRDNIGDLVINAFLLIAFLLGLCVIGGVFFGGFRLLSRKLSGRASNEEPLIVLDLHSR